MGINLHGRFHYQVNEKVRVVPVGHLGFSSSSRTFNPGAAQPKQETDYGTFGFNLGVGINYKVNQNNLIVLAIDPFGYFKTKTDVKNSSESTVTTTTLPRLYLGGETTIKSWLVGRIGAYRAYQTQTTKTKPAQGEEVKSSFQLSPYNVSFGLGLKFGNFLIDIEINDGLLFEGPNFISGRTRDMVNRVSVSYLFANHERSKK